MCNCTVTFNIVIEKYLFFSKVCYIEEFRLKRTCKMSYCVVKCSSLSLRSVSYLSYEKKKNAENDEPDCFDPKVKVELSLSKCY